MDRKSVVEFATLVSGITLGILSLVSFTVNHVLVASFFLVAIVSAVQWSSETARDIFDEHPEAYHVLLGAISMIAIVGLLIEILSLNCNGLSREGPRNAPQFPFDPSLPSTPIASKSVRLTASSVRSSSVSRVSSEIWMPVKIPSGISALACVEWPAVSPISP